MGKIIASKIIIPSGDSDVPEMNYTLIIVISVGGILILVIVAIIVGVILKEGFKR